MSETHEEFTFRILTRRNAVLFLGTFMLVMGLGADVRPAVMAGEFLLVLMLVQYFLHAGTLDKLQVRRDHFPRTFEGDEVVVKLEVTNQGATAAHLVDVVDSFPPGASYQIISLALHLPARSQLEFQYRQVCSRRRGLYLLGPVKLKMNDPLGLFTFRRTEDELTKLIVYPQALPIRTFEVLGVGTHFDIGEEIAGRTGHSEEFARIRRYQAGDPPRVIHWPTTARQGIPHIKEFEQSVVTEVFIYCDLYLLALSGLGDQTSAEFRIKAAASIAAETIRRHHLVKVIAAKSPRDQTTLAGGTQHLINALNWLALLKAEGRGDFEDDVLDDSALLRRGSTVVLVMSTVHVQLEKLTGLVDLLKLRNIRIIAVLVDDRSFHKLRGEQDQVFKNAPALDELKILFQRRGCAVYSVSNQQEVSQQLGIPA